MLNAQAFATYSFGLDSFECGRFRSIPNNSKRLLLFPTMSHRRLHRGIRLYTRDKSQLLSSRCSNAKVSNISETTKQFPSFFSRGRVLRGRGRVFSNKQRLFGNKRALLRNKGWLLEERIYTLHRRAFIAILNY